MFRPLNLYMGRPFKPYLQIIVLDWKPTVNLITWRRTFEWKSHPSAGIPIRISSLVFAPGIIFQASGDRGIQNPRIAAGKALVKNVAKAFLKTVRFYNGRGFVYKRPRPYYSISLCPRNLHESVLGSKLIAGGKPSPMSASGKLLNKASSEPGNFI